MYSRDLYAEIMGTISSLSISSTNQGLHMIVLVSLIVLLRDFAYCIPTSLFTQLNDILCILLIIAAYVQCDMDHNALHMHSTILQ